MDKQAVVKQLCEYYGIPPLHASIRRGDETVIKNLEGEFKLPILEVEKLVKFDRIKNFWETQTRRIGKDVTALIKQVTR
jgi:hypothetical protein